MLQCYTVHPACHLRRQHLLEQVHLLLLQLLHAPFGQHHLCDIELQG